MATETLSRKQCNVCGFFRYRDEYCKSKDSKDGLHYICSPCDSKRRRRQYRENHERELAHARKKRELYRDELNAERRRRYADDPAKFRLGVKKWVEENRERVRLSNNLGSHRRRNSGEVTKNEWLALCEAFGDVCVDCGIDGKLTMDHVIPISQGGMHTIENLQPLCGSCNSRKNRYVVIDYRLPWKRAGKAMENSTSKTPDSVL